MKRPRGHPVCMDRRTFVKGCVAVAGAGALAATGISVAGGLVAPRARAPPLVRYFGAHRVGGPAPVGVPYVPITVEDGVFVAKTSLPRLAGRELDPLAWHAYCGLQRAPGVKPGYAGDNVLCCSAPEEKLRVLTPWYKGLVGQPLRPEHFPDAGFGAPFAWRSQGETDPFVLRGVLVRVDASEVRHVRDVRLPAKPLRDDEFDFVRREVFWGDYVAVNAACTHFCCTAGYRESRAIAEPRNGWDNLFCLCHNANFDFRTPVAYEGLRADERSFQPIRPASPLTGWPVSRPTSPLSG